MVDIRMIPTLHEIDPISWNACFTSVVENYHYLLAIEEAHIAGFSWAYVTAWEENTLVAAMPAFFTDYALDTTLQGTGKKITTTLALAFPALLTVKLACLGSPCTETGMIGFHQSINETKKVFLIQSMMSEFERYAAIKNCKLIGIKDIPDMMESLWDSSLHSHHYARLAGMPTAYLDIDFATIDEYMARLSASTRKDMRRKLKQAHAVDIRITTCVEELLHEMMPLYRDTRNRSDWQFEELTEDYFNGVLANMPKHSFCTLYYVDGTLLAVNLLIHDTHTLIDKFFCMNNSVGREYNLYFLSWFTNIGLCIERGFTRYQSGQAYYDNKVRLGSKLHRNHMYFKHRNVLAQGILKLVAPLLAVDDTVKAAA